MGLVDYSDSESDSETQSQTPQHARQALPSSSKSSSTKPFQKLVSRSNPGKIVVSLPTASGADGNDWKSGEEPPAKRAKTGGGGGGRFSNFSSFLPPPKATSKPAVSQAAAGKVAPRPGVHLKTGAEPAFSRASAGEDASEIGERRPESGSGSGSGLNLPPPKQSHEKAGPSIHPDQKPVEEVKLVGKPLMFRPLSVARKPAKKKSSGLGGIGGTATGKVAPVAEKSPAAPQVEALQEEPKKKKVSLFSIADESVATGPEPTPSNGVYEPLFTTSAGEDSAAIPAYGDDSHSSYAQYPSAADAAVTAHQPHQSQSLSAIADDLNLSASARRELFGREGMAGSGAAAAAASSAKVINFDMSREYQHNEAVRASGETVIHNPLRAIAPGKHSLRQVVNAVQNNRTALEDSFATAKGNKREAAGRYGW